MAIAGARHGIIVVGVAQSGLRSFSNIPMGLPIRRSRRKWEAVLAFILMAICLGDRGRRARGKYEGNRGDRLAARLPRPDRCPPRHSKAGISPLGSSRIQAQGKTTPLTSPVRFVAQLGRKDPFVAAADDPARVVKIQQRQAEPIETAAGRRAHAVVKDQPAFGRFQGWRT